MPRMEIGEAWSLLFQRHSIPERVERDGLFRITATEINTVREARLMAKFDQSRQLPGVFRRHGLSILPVTRGEYVIGPFSAHAPVVYSDARPRRVRLEDLDTIDPSNLNSEAAALLCAFHSGVLHDVLGSERVAQTVSGRMASGSFFFSIANRRDPSAPFRIGVENAQIEIDGGYETPELFCVCEAKNIAAEEILIRQLYYPYRLWRSRLRKPVVPLFFVFSNDVFHAFLYRFAGEEDYGSLELLSHRAYTLRDEDIRPNHVEALWSASPPGPEPGVTFPQADSFPRVADLLFLLRNGPLPREEVTARYGFDDRQTGYYASAGEYLGLLEKAELPGGEDGLPRRALRLTREGARIMGLPYGQKYLALMAAILSRPVFHRAYGLYLRSGSLPARHDIEQLMASSGLPLSAATITRRSSTVRGWLEWILHQSGGVQETLPGW